jgi:hypothetical protein
MERRWSLNDKRYEENNIVFAICSVNGWGVVADRYAKIQERLNSTV